MIEDETQLIKRDILRINYDNGEILVSLLESYDNVFGLDWKIMLASTAIMYYHLRNMIKYSKK